MGSLGRVSTGIGWALRAHWGIFAAVTSVVLALDVLVPVVVLSLARKPVDYFTFNPWLPSLPGYLASGKGPLSERLDKAWGLALFWFSADGVFGIDWGFAVTTADLARFAAGQSERGHPPVSRQNRAFHFFEEADGAADAVAGVPLAASA